MTKNMEIPVWRRYTLTIEEAAGFYQIGEGKLRMLIDGHPNEDGSIKKCLAELPISYDRPIRRAKLVLL